MNLSHQEVLVKNKKEKFQETNQSTRRSEATEGFVLQLERGMRSVSDETRGKDATTGLASVLTSAAGGTEIKPPLETTKEQVKGIKVPEFSKVFMGYLEFEHLLPSDQDFCSFYRHLEKKCPANSYKEESNLSVSGTF